MTVLRCVCVSVYQLQVVWLSLGVCVCQSCANVINADPGENIPTVFIAVAGRSNGLGPVLSGNATWPVLNCPPLSADWGSCDVWSSLRLPSGDWLLFALFQFLALFTISVTLTNTICQFMVPVGGSIHILHLSSDTYTVIVVVHGDFASLNEELMDPTHFGTFVAREIICWATIYDYASLLLTYHAP